MELQLIWTMYYAGIVSIKSHPRNGMEADLGHCARIADNMLREHLRRFPYQETPQWLGSDPSSAPPSAE